jgi:hypothetical protein
VAVSPNYIDELSQRYQKVFSANKRPCVAIPFAASEQDFKLAEEKHSPEAASDRRLLEVVYVGAGGAIMAKSFNRIVQGLARIRATNRELVDRIKIRLFGTYAYWKTGEPKPLKAIAISNGVVDLVEEEPARVSYLKAMDLILHADGLIILGVDDPAYMPSKLFTYGLTGKPLLVSLHRDSQANRYFQEMPGLGHLVHFDGDRERVSHMEDREIEVFLSEIGAGQRFDRKHEIEPYLSPAAARQHARFFERVISS